VQRQLFIMVKEPGAGRVKTRLGKDIGMVPAAWWFRHQAMSLIRKLEDPRWKLTLAISPDVAALSSRFWPEHISRVGQGRGDLGQRMTKLLQQGPPGPICIVGNDIPSISKKHIIQSFKALGESEWVFGPANDGGFWLVGTKGVSALSPALFKGVRWSSKNALKDSLSSIPSRRVAFIDWLSDVDTAVDL
jgi:rSAM/selenodomain-associated transferase 1